MPEYVTDQPTSDSPAAGQLLRVLHLEDNPLDAELVAATLADSGLHCRISLVDTEEAFSREAERSRMDVILADYSLPSFDGMSALRIARQVCPETPFLFLSGAIGEEQAIETLKAGAVDYVLKQRLERLVPSVRRALREAEDRIQRRRAEESLKESQERLRQARDELEVRVIERTSELAAANTALEAEIAERKRAEAEVRRANRALRILSESNQVLVRTTDEGELLRKICQIAVQYGGYSVAWVGRAEHDQDKTVAPLAYAGCDREVLEGLQITWADVERGRGPTGTAIRTGEPSVTHDVKSDPRYGPWRETAASRGIVSSVALPLVIDSQVFGAMSIYTSEAEALDDTEVRLLRELADDMAFGIGTMRLRVERQKAIDALQVSEQQYRRIVQTAEEGIWVLDDKDISTFINQKMAGMLGHSVEEMLGRPILDFVHEWDRQAFEASLRRRRSGIKDSHDARFIRKDGGELWGIVAGAPILDEAGRYIGALKMVTDITERKNLERDIAEISSLEQQRIGRDLHDVLGQNLTGMSFLSKILEQKLSHLGREEAADAAEIGRLATLTNRQARSLARGLSPLGLTAANFEAGLKDFAAGVQDIFSISCACQCDSHVRIPDDDAAVHLYRITQEAVTNAVRHGKAKNVMIQLTEQDGRNLLMIQDDGSGMPRQMEKHQGMGLQIMNYRAGVIGGQLKIRSQGRGTVVICSFGQNRQ